jgi:two-component system chemotaxis response regulator CheB
MSKTIVIGGSFGAIDALKVILPMLPQDFPAAILVVTHIGANTSILPSILGSRSAIPVRHATNDEPISPGHVLVGPPDEHFTVVMKGGQAHVRLTHGPKENHSRPAIDPLFRSAAAAFREDTIGVLLSGNLDDGTVGLQAVKACGGLVIVQDPFEAEALDMPASALEHVDVDRVLGIRKIGQALIELTASSVEPSCFRHQFTASVVPNWVETENRISCKDSDMADLDQIGTPSSVTCPECSGALWEISHSRPIRYRCHTGHAFTARVLESLQAKVLEDAVWGAVRALHEQERLFSKLCDTELRSDNKEGAAEYRAKADQARAYSKSLRDVIATRGPIVEEK